MTGDLLDRIDEVTADVCHQCGGALRGSVSPWFCSSECQTVWTAHENDVQQIVGYREAMPSAVGWCEDEARWQPRIWIEDWSATRAWVDRIVKTAEKEWRSLPVVERIEHGVTSTAYVRPERTDDPADDYLVAQFAALWARRLGLFGEWMYASALAEEVRPEVPSALALMAEAVKPALDSMARSFRQITSAFLPQIPATHAPQQREGDRITLQMDGRTIRGTVAYSDGVTLRVRPDQPEDERDELAQAALVARRTRNTGPQVHADPRRNRRGP